MHRLHRDPAPPAGLGHYRHGQHTWSNTCPTPGERAAIWHKLDAMQGGRCAYCEGEPFLVFIPTGAIRPRAGLSPHDQHRAKETIRILGLDGALNQIRRAEVSGYIQTAEVFAEMAESFSEEEWLPLLQEEIQNIAHLPFATAIKHVLTRQSETA